MFPNIQKIIKSNLEGIYRFVILMTTTGRYKSVFSQRIALFAQSVNSYITSVVPFGFKAKYCQI